MSKAMDSMEGPAWAARFLEAAVVAGSNIVVAGAVGAAHEANEEHACGNESDEASQP